ncbi:MAG: MFS transporter [Chloroflexota bacterium]|nr:MFS transporter [Chloroflexota bacterium]
MSASLSKNRDFKVFLGGQGVSALGDAVSFTALPLIVLLLTGSGLALGIVGVLTTLPDLIFGLPAGALADRWDRRRMMLYADLGRAALTALVPLSFLLGLDTFIVILLVTAPINLMRVLFMAAFTAAVPDLVGRDRIGQANGLIEGIFSLGFVVGPAVAGLLVGTIGPGPTLAIDAATFLFSALALSAIHRPMKAQRETGSGRTRISADIAEGVRFILAHPTLRMAIGFWGLISVASASLVPAVIFYLTIDRQQPETVAGAVLSAYFVGWLLGALLAVRLVKRRLGLVMLLSNVATGVMLAMFVLVDTGPLQFAAAMGAGISTQVVIVAYVTLRASIPPNELLGRVGSTARTISIGAQPAGYFAGGLLLDAVGGGATLLIISSGIVLLSVLFSLSSSLRQATMGSAAPGSPTVP